MKPPTQSYLRNGRTRQRQKGSALVEFAFAAPMFAMLLVGASDFARVFYAGVGVSGIATTGAEWLASDVTRSALADSSGNASTDSTNNATIKAAAIVETSTLTGATPTANEPSLTVVATRTCLCTGDTTSDCSAFASVCSDNNPRKIEVTVTASMTYVPLIRYPGLPVSIPISYRNVVRAQ